MKVVARIELKPGMVIAEDILNYKNEIIVMAGTKVTDNILKKLARQSIMAVPIKEEIDFSTTHFEKVRMTDGFKNFESIYNIYFPVFKRYMLGAVNKSQPINLSQFMEVYTSIIAGVKSGEHLLDYLYNLIPDEGEMTLCHCLNSALIAGVFATWLGLSNNDTLLLIQCAFLYDIGKFSIPYQILWKPQRLSPEEYTLVMQHTQIGYDFLQQVGTFDPHILKATLQHHERCNGTGYPSSLSADEIDQFAKYIAIIDSYEAMTSPRTYRKKLHPFQIIANYENEGFERYDVQALKSFLSHIANSQLGFNVQLSNERLGTVILINEKALSRPLIKLNEDNTLIDLSKERDIKITQVF